MTLITKYYSGPRWLSRFTNTNAERQLAIALAALSQKPQYLKKLPEPFPGEYSYFPDKKKAQLCIVAYIMRNNQLVRGAQFIDDALMCNERDYVEESEPESLNRADFLNANFQSLHLTDIDEAGKFHMGMADLHSDITTTTPGALVDMGPGPITPSYWSFDSYLTDPNFYQFLQRTTNS
ncbi:hypothetical protein BJ085DRAFT_27462 [Dimargaris cristalligena]|uniref:Uncharacterized protein n=1 Tax=Dimargaris cristalligena TaxID=215637 RepID=A0A4P9ZQR8_9FUNG|nr:hypothetical protein BJ085DRAFT_27462 [Dimargaris cristalligena]|eukprot:RKP35834.1 hypothetical protein BJ085DRAFT_27462 [Dimargaris cristalligena]